MNEKNATPVQIDQNSTEHIFRTLLSQVKEITVPVFSMDLDANLAAWEITSITFMRVIMDIEDTFGFEFDLSNISLNKFPTVRKLLDYIDNNLNKQGAEN